MSRPGPLPIAALGALLLLAGCDREPGLGTIHLTISGSAVGAEADTLRRQVARFETDHPGITVDVAITPDSADQRHQLYVQWLNARAPAPDVLQLDVVWAAEMAAAGWIRPLGGAAAPDDDFFPAAREAATWQGRAYAVPLFVDVGMLYWRTDLADAPPATYDELARAAAAARTQGLDLGLVWQGARYEGLVTVFLEHLTAFGGAILDPEGRVVVDSPEAVQALAFMRDMLESGAVPRVALGWREEQTRFAFQNGRAAFMRNWPYAFPLLSDRETSGVARHFSVAPMPAGPGGPPAATLGGALLAINAYSRHPAEAAQLIRFLTAPEQLAERAASSGQYPPRRSLYTSGLLEGVLPIPPPAVLQIIERAVSRPVSPFYQELSALLQVQLHRALSGQAQPDEALAQAARDMERVLARGDRRPVSGAAPAAGGLLLAISLAAVAALVLALRRRPRPGRRGDERAAWALSAPALAVIALVALFPLGWTLWESLHHHDLRLPQLGTTFAGLDNYAELAGQPRFWAALMHTAGFVAVSVALELLLGMALALAMDRAARGRSALRALVLLPWALPTVVAALVWQLLFSETGPVESILRDLRGGEPLPWFAEPLYAWLPIVLADVWKSTPFVALLLLAGLQTVDDDLYEAAKVDGANTWQRFRRITLPLLRPALLVALVFRSLDAFRVFDLIYVLTGGGPGTATEPLALYTFDSLLQNLRFGYGSALSVAVFAVSFGLALLAVRLMGRGDREAGA